MPDNNVQYAVVCNHEEQYSLWRVGKPIPTGWRESGFTGSREQCLAHIDEVWPDLSPLSLRLAR